MKTLRERLQRIDGQGYKAYKCIVGRYEFPAYSLIVDHVQGDPFAEPSRLRVCLGRARSNLAVADYSNSIRRTALEDYLCRRVAAAIAAIADGGRGSGRSGEIRIAECSQNVLLRDAVRVDDGRVEARLGLALPADGRRILGAEAHTMLFDELPRIVDRALNRANLDLAELQRHLDSVEDQSALRQWLQQAGLVAFVGDGACLPRRSGIDDRPMGDGVIPFETPPSLAVAPLLPHAGRIRGMGIAGGVSLIVGGGFHGKSTLLSALQFGVHDKIPGDGRERVVCEPTAVKIRAEDGRAVNRIDISGFVDRLPLGRDTHRFDTENASGSTSQAANIVEAVCAGCRTLLIDEDTSASNFMFRDRSMQQLVAPEREPITPLVDRIGELYRSRGISTIIVSGASSAFFDHADRVIMLDAYRARDVSVEAGLLAPRLATVSNPPPFSTGETDTRAAGGDDPAGIGATGAIKIQAYAMKQLRLGAHNVELDRIEQLVEPGQVLAIGHLIRRWSQQQRDLPGRPLLDELRELLRTAEDARLELLSPFPGQPHGGLTLPRIHELSAAINRLRGLVLAD